MNLKDKIFSNLCYYRIIGIKIKISYCLAEQYRLYDVLFDSISYEKI